MTLTKCPEHDLDHFKLLVKVMFHAAWNNSSGLQAAVSHHVISSKAAGWSSGKDTHMLC